MLDNVSSSLLNKLVSKDLVHGMTRLKFSDGKVCDACVKNEINHILIQIKEVGHFFKCP